MLEEVGEGHSGEELTDPGFGKPELLRVAWGEELPGTQEEFCAFGTSARYTPFFPTLTPDTHQVLVFIFSEWCAASCNCACVFAKFVTNFLFGFGLRLGTWCVLKPRCSQRSSVSLLAAMGRPLCPPSFC